MCPIHEIKLPQRQILFLLLCFRGSMNSEDVLKGKVILCSVQQIGEKLS